MLYFNHGKEVRTLGKNKKSGNKKASLETKLNLVTAILNLVIALILLYEKLTS
jgi:hypothetical protein